MDLLTGVVAAVSGPVAGSAEPSNQSRVGSGPAMIMHGRVGEIQVGQPLLIVRKHAGFAELEEKITKMVKTIRDYARSMVAGVQVQGKPEITRWAEANGSRVQPTCPML